MLKYSNSNEWFEIIKYKDYLYVIRERLDEIDPRFYTNYTNLYLILGSHSALLIDTGCGLFPLKPILEEVISDKKLLVINTHSHFDHIGGNSEFEEIFVHKNEVKSASKPFDIRFLEDSPRNITKLYEKINYTIKPAKHIKPVKNGEIFDLGDKSIQIIHTPGHSSGSISLLTSNFELFVGDTAHYGMMYITKKTFPIILSSISELISLFEKNNDIEIYPAHEDYTVGKELLVELRDGIKNIDNIWDTRIRDNFLEAWVLSDENFKYAVF